MRALAVALAVVTLTPASVLAAASGQSTDQVVPRMNRRLGIILGAGSPSPGLLGVNVAYNILEAVRAEVGVASITTSVFGEETSSTTFGGGVKAFVPGWKFSPTAGLHLGFFSTKTSGVFSGETTKAGSHVYGSVGMDYQANGGFNVGFGYAVSFRSDMGSSAFVNLGWFFDWLG